MKWKSKSKKNISNLSKVLQSNKKELCIAFKLLISDSTPENSSPRRLNYIKSKVSWTISPKNEESSTATNLKRIRKDTKKRNIDLVARKKSREKEREDRKHFLSPFSSTSS